MTFAITITILVLQILNFVVHTFGCYLLICIFRDRNSDVQVIYLLNLSITEAVMSFMGILITPPASLFITLSKKTSVFIHQVQYYVMIVLEAGVLLVYYMTMMYITLDRLLEIYWNIRYPVKWSKRKAKYLVGITWIVCLTASISVCLCTHFFGIQLERPFVLYVYPTLDIGFLILTSVTYIMIFHKFKKTRIAPAISRNTSKKNKKTRKRSTLEVFRKSQFKVPLLLITSFILFMIIPDLLYLTIGIIKNERSEKLVGYCFISITLSYLIDGYIYLYLHIKVRVKLQKKVHKWFHRRSVRLSSSGSTSSAANISSMNAMASRRRKSDYQ